MTGARTLDQWYRRLAWPIVAAFALAAPAVGWGFWLALGTSQNDVRQWLPEGHEEARIYQQFQRHFGTDEFIFVSCDGCTLDDDRLGRLADAIRRQHPPGDPDSYFRRVETAGELLARLARPPIELPPQQAVDRLTGLVVARDRQTAGVLAILSDTGAANRTEAVAEVRRQAERAGIPAENLRMAGPPVFNVAIDEASEQATGYLPLWSAAIALLVAAASLRSVRLSVLVFLVATYCGGLAQAIIYFTGGVLNLVLVITPVLIYVLTLSACVHLANYYRDALQDGPPIEAPARAVRRGALPCWLAALTTAVGVGALQVSGVVPVHDFGFYSAIGILAGIVVVFLLLPALLIITEPAGGAQRHPGAHPGAAGQSRFRRAVDALASFVAAHHAWLSIVCLALLAFAAWGVGRLETSVRLDRFFPPQADVLQDYAWFERTFGPQTPLELVVVFDDERSPLSRFERMEVVRAIERQVREIELIGATMSAATFAPLLPAEVHQGRPTGVMGTVERTMRRRAFERELEVNRQWLLASGYYSEPENAQWWRISARAPVGGLAYDQLLARVAASVERFLDEQPEERVAGVHIVYTGMAPLFHMAQRELLTGLFRSFLLAFALIALPIAFVLRSVRGTLVAMLPNVFPAAVVFGFMGHASIAVDIGAMLTASAAMGIAVDDTIHFLTWFRRGLDQRLNRHEAVRYAYQRCAPAMMQTSAIVGLGLVVYAMSAFVPVAQFGLLMFVLLGVTLVGDLVLLPALLAGPAGRVFAKHERARA